MRRTFIFAVALLTLFTSPPVVSAQNTYIVNSDGSDPDVNPGNGICQTATGVCTLRAAIQEANLDGGASRILFSRQLDISYPNLPEITGDETIIDGSQQWDTNLDQPGVSIVQASNYAVLVIKADSCEVKGLEFFGSTPGIDVCGSYNLIGGEGERDRNVFITDIGVQRHAFCGAGGEHNTITNNYFGTRDGDRVVMAGKYGISLFRCRYCQITNNLIVGQTMGAGIILWQGASNTVRSNIIGADSFMQRGLPNKVGILIQEGSDDVIRENFIYGNQSHGIELYRTEATVESNRIGWNAYQSLINGGDGVYARLNGLNTIRDNLIRGNAGNGIFLESEDEDLIQSNTITNSGQDGIHVVSGQNHQIGGSGEREGNTIENNSGDGIHITGSYSSGNHVVGNTIGGAYWEAPNQGCGILVDDGAHGNEIGEGNWINWNRQSGILLNGDGTTDNTVIGNVIGAAMHWGWEAPNRQHGIGIFNDANENRVGLLGKGNTILASGYSGLTIGNAHANWIVSNRIGTDGGSHHWGNQYYGIHIFIGSDNTLVLNEIAYNGVHAGEAGVRMEGATAVRNDLNYNIIHDNGGKGIELLYGANNNLAAPVLMLATSKRVKGVACKDCIVEIFSDLSDEGRFYEGSVRAGASNGSFIFSGSLRGPNVTAVARFSNDASEFSAPLRVFRGSSWLMLLLD